LVRNACENTKAGAPKANFAVVSNPEFLRQGSALTESLYPDRIVIGTDNPQALKVLTDLYQPILDQDFPAPACLPRKPGLTSVPLLTCDQICRQCLPGAQDLLY
jgi:UDPglucose 6-dehydrogenase